MLVLVRLSLSLFVCVHVCACLCVCVHIRENKCTFLDPSGVKLLNFYLKRVSRANNKFDDSRCLPCRLQVHAKL